MRSEFHADKGMLLEQKELRELTNVSDKVWQKRTMRKPTRSDSPSICSGRVQAGLILPVIHLQADAVNVLHQYENDYIFV